MWWKYAVLAVTFCLYAPHVGNDFVRFDDHLLITENPVVMEMSKRTIAYAFSSYDPELFVPLTLLSYQLEYALFGPLSWVFHLTNLLLHLLNVFLVWWIVRSLTKREWIPVFAAAFFALHPLHTEAVLWASARKDVLSLAGMLSSLALYLRYLQTNRPREYVGSLILFFLALLAKVSAITLPVILLLFDVFERRSTNPSAWKEKAPFFLFSGVFGVVALIGKTQVLQHTSLGTTVVLALKSTAFYLQKLCVPLRLSVLYPQELPVTWTDLVPGLVALGFLVVLVVFFWKRSRLVTCGIVFYLITLLPTFTNFQKNGFLFFASDRYAYLPSFGIVMALAGAAILLMERWSWMRQIILSITVAVLAVWIPLTTLQARTWQNTRTLFTHVLDLYPNSALAHNNVGAVALEEDETLIANQHLEIARSIDPSYTVPAMSLARLRRREGKMEEAEEIYRETIAAVREKELVLAEDVSVFAIYAQFLEERGRGGETLTLYEEAVEIGPHYPEPHFNLGVMYHKSGRSKEAIREFEAVTHITARHADTYYHLASLYAESGNLQAARKALERVLWLDPGNEDAKRHLENIRGMLQ